MPPTIQLLESRMTKLWDFGWFDRSTFRVLDPVGRAMSGHDVLQGFVRQPLVRRRFCTQPDPWGAAVDVHGPLIASLLTADAYTPVPIDQLRRRVEAIFEDPKFRLAPADAQRMPVHAWLDATCTRGDDVYVLALERLQAERMEFYWIWSIFSEFVCIAPDRSEIVVAVIGLD